MGSCFASSARVADDPGKSDATKLPQHLQIPENLQSEAEALTALQDVPMIAIANILKELEALIKPPRKCCKYGKKCYRHNPLHRLEVAHPGDVDWHSKGEPARVPLDAAVRGVAPFASLRRRLARAVVTCLSSLPAAAAIEMTAGPDTDGAEADERPGAASPPVDIDSDDVPFDLAAFLEGVRDETLQSDGLGQRIAACVVVGMAAVAGLRLDDHSEATALEDMVEAAAKDASQRFLSLATRRGKGWADDGAGLLYCVMALLSLGARDSPLLLDASGLYAEMRGLPGAVVCAVLDMMSADAVLPVYGAQRVGWLRLEDLLVGAAADGKALDVDAMEVLLPQILDPFGTGAADQAADSVRGSLASVLAGEMRNCAPGEDDGGAKLEICAAWETGLEGAEGVAAVRKAMPLVRLWDIAIEAVLQDVAPVPEAVGDTCQELLRWALEQGTPGVLHYALFAAHSLRHAAGCPAADDASNAWRELLGLPEWWNPEAVFSLYGTDGYAGLAVLRDMLVLDDAAAAWSAAEARPALLGIVNVDEEFQPGRDFVACFIAAAMMRDAHTEPIPVDSVEVEAVKGSVPLLQWRDLAEAVELQGDERVTAAAMKGGVEYIRKSTENAAAARVGGDDEGAAAILFVAIFLAAAMGMEEGESLVSARRGYAALHHCGAGRPVWWDFSAEFEALSTDDIIDRQAWAALRRVGRMEFPTSAQELSNHFRLDAWPLNSACKLLSAMILHYIERLPLDLEAEAEDCAPALLCVEEGEERPRCGGPPVSGVVGLFGLCHMARKLIDDPADDEDHAVALHATALRYLKQAQAVGTVEVLWYALVASTMLRGAEPAVADPRFDAAWEAVTEDYRNRSGLPEAWDIRSMALYSSSSVAAKVAWERAVEIATTPQPVSAHRALEECRGFCKSRQSAAALALIQAKIVATCFDVEPYALAKLTELDAEGDLSEIIGPLCWYRIGTSLVADGSISQREYELQKESMDFEAPAKALLKQAIACEQVEGPILRAMCVASIFSLRPGSREECWAKERYNECKGLPRWFDIRPLVDIGLWLPGVRQAFRLAVSAAQQLPGVEMLARLHSDLHGDDGAVANRGVSERDAKAVERVVVGCAFRAFTSAACLAEQAAVFPGLFDTKPRDDCSLASVVVPAVQVKAKALEILGTDAEELIVFAAVEHLKWGSLPRNRDGGLLFALFAAWALCQDVCELPGEFEEACDKYGVKDSDAKEMLAAYDRWELGMCLAALRGNRPLDVDQLADALSHFHRTHKEVELQEGVEILIPVQDELMKQCKKHGTRLVLLRKMMCKKRAAEAMWRNVAGRKATIMEVSEGVLKVRTEVGAEAWIPVPADGVGAFGFDKSCEALVVEAIRQALDEAPVLDDDEIRAFEEAKESGGSELEASLRVVALWSIVQLHHMESVFEEVRERVATKHMQAAMAEGQSRVALQVGLYVGFCLGANTTPAFDFVAMSYRALRELPPYWDVGEMVAAYSRGSLAPGSVWEQAENALSRPNVDRIEVNSLLAKADDTEGEPWKALRAALPNSVPAYWDSSGDTGRFDRMVSVAMHDPLGRPSDIYPLVQRVFDDTWKYIATQDRPCPNGRCKKRKGGCACVQKDGDPGMPQGLRVRRIVRIEDSDMWERYMNKKNEIATRRAGDMGPGLDVKTSPLLADASDFQEFDPAANEMYLFHGTFVRAALSIASAGFNMNLAGSNVGTMYGNGGYFCECCSKADEYARDEPGGYYEGVFAMLLCRIAFGKPFITEDRDPEARQLTLAGVSDSTLGDRESAANTYREFVIYDIDQVYPEYVILYERLGRGYEVQGGLGWGALREGDAKIVLEVPSHWENAHINPEQTAFQGCYKCLGLMTLFLQELARRQQKLAGGECTLRVKEAYRLEDSESWVKYLQARRRVQTRNADHGIDSLALTLGEAGTGYASAAEKAIVMEALRGNARNRCKFGARCYRKDKNFGHAREFSHPGDPDWDLRGEDVPAAKLSAVASWLLEGVDRRINELYLWCGVSWINSIEDVYHLQENGVEPLFEDRHGVRYLRLTESPDECLARLPPSDEGKQALLLCRTICGVVEQSDDLDDVGNMQMALAGRKDCVVKKSDDGLYHDYVVFSPMHIYPEYCVFLGP